MCAYQPTGVVEIMVVGRYGQVKNIVVLRPGALGDVLVCRHLLHWLMNAFPEARIAFVAPGERGRLFRQFGLAHISFDWENAAFSWLFSHGDAPPPPLLHTLFEPGTLVFAYLDLAGEEAQAFQKRLSTINTPLFLFLSPSRPADGSGVYIGAWLVQKAIRYCQMQQFVFVSPHDASEVRLGYDKAGASLTVDAEQDASVLVVHPGSGSAKKNWPLPSFAALVSLLMSAGEEVGLRRIRIVAGEAEAGLGAALAATLSEAELIEQPPLVELTKIMAGAGLYLGSDSGVSHLAAAARTRAGVKPRVAAVFGPSDPLVWAAPGTLVLEAGGMMDALSPEMAFTSLQHYFFPSCE